MDSADRKMFLKQTLLPADRGIGAAVTSSSEPQTLLMVQSQKVKDNSEALLPPSGQALAQLLLNFHGGKLDFINPFSWVPTMPALPGVVGHLHPWYMHPKVILIRGEYTPVHPHPW